MNPVNNDVYEKKVFLSPIAKNSDRFFPELCFVESKWALKGHQYDIRLASYDLYQRK